MLYFISDFGFFGDDETEDILKQNILCLKEKMEKDDEQNNEQNESILLLGGDNFYPDGIEHNKDIKMILFGKYFDFLPKNRIYAVLGNHDYCGNVRLQLESQYFTCKPDFYVVKYKTLDVYMIDTTMIDYMTHTNLPRVYANIYPESFKAFQMQHEIDVTKATYDSIRAWTRNKKRMLDDMYLKRRQLLKELDERLQKSTNEGREIVIVGHYPPQTYGSYYMHNNQNIVMKHLGPLILKHNINYFVCGHDHNNQHIYYTEDELDHLLRYVQYRTRFDDNDHFHITLQDHQNERKTRKKQNNGLHIYVCGSFVETYSGPYMDKQQINRTVGNKVVKFDTNKKSYITIEATDDNIIFNFIDTSTNTQYYSSIHTLNT